MKRVERSGARWKLDFDLSGFLFQSQLIQLLQSCAVPAPVLKLESLIILGYHFLIIIPVHRDNTTGIDIDHCFPPVAFCKAGGLKAKPADAQKDNIGFDTEFTKT